MVLQTSPIFIDCFHRSTVETLLEKGFFPTRTVVLAFGFDEETSGLFVSLLSQCLLNIVSYCGDQGAGKIGDYLLEQYGENSFALLVDEGGLWIAT